MRARTTGSVGLALALLITASPAVARESRAGGKLVLTDGVTTVEGSAGGGLATWAVIAGAETEDGFGGSAHVTLVALPDFDLTSYGAAIGIRNRVELSYANQSFDTRAAGAALGLGRNFIFAQDVFGAKLRLIGDAVYDQDRILPQISVGVQYKVANQPAIIRAVGGRQSRGTDFYVSATKVLLAQSLVVDTTVRLTKANQFGLLGFGGDKDDGYSAQFEGSLGMLLRRDLVIGGEFRTKPDNLGFAREQNVYDLFAAYAVHRYVTLTAAYTDLGDIATVKGQRGAFLSIQGRF
jgi:Protein of unknown function (DUF3034)